MLRLVVTQKGFTTAAHKLEGTARKAENTEAILKELAFDIRLIEYQTFAAQGRRGGGSWKKLKEATVQKKIETSEAVDRPVAESTPTRTPSATTKPKSTASSSQNAQTDDLAKVCSV